MIRITGWTLLRTLAGCSSALLAEPPTAPTAPETPAESTAADAAEAAPEAPTPAVPLKLATWNLQWRNRANGTGNVKRTNADYERPERYAERLGADITALQEIDGEEALRSVFDDAPYDYHVAAQDGVQLTGFAYRAGLSVTENTDYTELDVGDVRVGVDLP
jgi:hypothetical protein